MKILETIAEVKDFIKPVKEAGKIIGLVPTMGALHEGHLSLMRRAREVCDIVIASIFVNPTQFGPNEDFDAYPRTFDADCEKLSSAGVDAVFYPAVAQMYPRGYTAFVEVDGALTAKLCGAKRPGHFRGVATVVTKLMNITEANKAFFGQKDAQQVVVIERFVRDLNINTMVEMVPIVRAGNGLALSSRNKYLSVTEKEAALVLYKSLQAAKAVYENGERSTEKIKALVISMISAEQAADIDYVEIYTFPGLIEVETISQPVLLALAVRFGTTRLIDNIVLGDDI